MIEIDSVAAEIYGEFEAYFIKHNHAERISKMIVDAASNGKTSIKFTWQELDTWFDEDISRHTKNPVTKKRYLNSITLKKVTIMAHDEIHISYGKFLICKMAEQLANAFEGKITVNCVLPEYTFQKEICQLTFDWSDENCHFKRVYIRDFFPLTIFLKDYDWDDWFLDVATIFGLTLGAVMISLCIGIIFLIISETAADMAVFISFILEIALNFIIKFKPKRKLIYEGNVFND